MVIDDLIAQGYNIHEYDADRGFYPIHLIMHECKLSYTKWFMEKYNGVQDLEKPTPKHQTYPILMAIRPKGGRGAVTQEEDVYKVLEYLIKLGVNLKVSDIDGYALLYYAC